MFPTWVSTQEQSTDLQKSEIIAYLTARGWSDYLLFEDTGISGAKANRPALNEMLHAVRSRKVDLVVVWKLDRLFRSLVNLLQTLREFQELDVEFICNKDEIDMTKSSGRLMMNMIGAFSECERSLIQERVRAGVKSAQSRGVRFGRPKSHVTTNQALRLRRDGMTYRAIAKKLKISPAKVCLLLKDVSR
jgi:putative DNA-invertase from lambdoid prophage Rac